MTGYASAPRKDVEMNERLIYQRVVKADRAYAKGYGWWHIVLECGHQADVLHGGGSPFGQQVACRYRCGESQKPDDEATNGPTGLDPNNQSEHGDGPHE